MYPPCGGAFHMGHHMEGTASPGLLQVPGITRVQSSEAFAHHAVPCKVARPSRPRFPVSPQPPAPSDCCSPCALSAVWACTSTFRSGQV